MNFKVEIKKKEASAVAGCIVCGNSDYSITFAFDSEWAELPVKTARFIYVQDDQVKHQDVVFEGTTVEVPVLRNITEVFVGVFAGELHTTTPARIVCKKSILCGDASIQDEPSPDVYAQILELVNTKLIGERELPAVTAEDKDKVLAVNENGEWVEVDKAPKAQNADNAANSEKLGGFHYYDLFPSAGSWISRTTGLKTKITLDAVNNNNTYVPVYIVLASDKDVPQFISIYKNLRSLTPAGFPNNHSNGSSSLWLQYEGRSLSWDDNNGYLKTLYRSNLYANLVLKTEAHRNCLYGFTIWLRAGVGSVCEYEIASNYPLTCRAIYEKTNLGTDACPYEVEPLIVSDDELGDYNLGVCTIKGNEQQRNKAYWGNTTEAEKVNGVAPSVYNRSRVIFKANTLTKIDLQIAVGAYVKEEYSDDGSKIYVFYDVTDVNAGLKAGASFDYSGELVEVVSDEAGGLLLKFEKGGALASLSGQTVTIGKRTAGNEAEELPVNRAVNSAQVNGLEITKQANGAISIGSYTGVGAEILTKKVRVVEGNNASAIDLSGFTEGWYEFDLVEPETANRLMFRVYYIPVTENLAGRLICSNAPCVAYGGVDNNGDVQIVSSTFYINQFVPIGGQYSLAGPAVNRTIIDLNGTTAEVQKLVTYQCKGIYKIVE